MITVFGIGPGDPKYLTLECVDKLKTCPLIIGTQRQLDTIRKLVASGTHLISYDGRLHELEAKLNKALESSSSAGILASGDPSFYGITPWIRRVFPELELEIITGVSSYQLIFSTCKIPMHDVYLTSVHGREFDIDTVISNKNVCLLTDSRLNPYKLSQMLLERGLNPLMTIGEALSYPDGRITTNRAEKIENRDYEFNVVYIQFDN